MAFNWEAFAARFIEGQTKAIRKRREDAEEFEDEQKEAADRNQKALSNRILLAQDAAQMGRKAMELGATQEQVMAAMSSGAMGIKTFYDKLIAAANQKGMTRLGEADIEQIMGMPEVFEVNPEYVDMGLQEFAKITYGAAPRPGMGKAEIETSDSIIAQLFGLDAMNQAKKNLQDTQYMNGMSVSDVNELARQAEYDSLFPNLGVNFFDREFYGPEAAGGFIKEVNDASAAAITGAAANAHRESMVDQLTLKQTKTINGVPNPDYDESMLGISPTEVERRANEYLVQQSLRPLVQTYVDKYGQTGIFDHQTSADLIKKIMGEDYYQEQLELIKDFSETPQEEETQTEQPTNTEQNQEDQTQETTETQTSDPTDQETPIPTEESNEELTEEEQYIQDVVSKYPPKPESKSLFDLSKDTRDWNKKYEGKLNEDGTPIIVSPRPAEGGEKTKTIPKINQVTGRPMAGTSGREVTEAEYWDFMYAETHYTNGRPKLPAIES